MPDRKRTAVPSDSDSEEDGDAADLRVPVAAAAAAKKPVAKKLKKARGGGAAASAAGAAPRKFEDGAEVLAVWNDKAGKQLWTARVIRANFSRGTWHYDITWVEKHKGCMDGGRTKVTLSSQGVTKRRHRLFQ
eukprot:COSAG06_NODE_13304_length_1270_cov_2.327925_1_plen_133_part_00